MSLYVCAYVLCTSLLCRQSDVISKMCFYFKFEKRK